MSRRALLISLIISLAVNLFVVGAVAGALVIGSRMHQARPGGGFRAAGPLWGAAEGLSPERQDAYRAALRGEAGVVGGKLRAARQARREAWLSLREERFDPKTAAVALDRARALEFEARGDVERRIVNFAATLTPAERAQLAEGLARAGPGRRHRDRSLGPEAPPRPSAE
jgi:uncharacterized membrane protein